MIVMETTENNRIKIQVQTVIVSISVLLLVGKFIAFYLTHSVGVLTDALESIVNVTAGFISLFSIRFAAKPKDLDHPYGHGKVEQLSASAEGLMIIAAGGLIIVEGIKRLFVPVEIEKLDVGIYIVAAAGAVNYLMGMYSVRIGRKYDSMALIAGGKHLQSDTYSTIGLVIGLIALHLTKIHWIDSALALVFGSVIVLTGISILKKTINNLMDRTDERMLKELSSIISRHQKPDWIDVHNLKTIKAGPIYYIDCDLTLPWYYNIIEGHNTCDELKQCVVSCFNQRAVMLIHTDPCDDTMCAHCAMIECRYRKAEFQSPPSLTEVELTQSDEEREQPSTETGQRSMPSRAATPDA